MLSGIQTALISAIILDDVNLLLGLVSENEHYHQISKTPSPWEVAHILLRMATYFEAIVFFEKVAYIRDEKTSPPLRDHLSLHDHLSLFDSDNPLENIRNEIALSPIDAPLPGSVQICRGTAF